MRTELVNGQATAKKANGGSASCSSPRLAEGDVAQGRVGHRAGGRAGGSQEGKLTQR